MRRKASILYQTIAQIILIALVFGLFFIGTIQRANSNVVKQQVLEKQTALLIDSAVIGMEFKIHKTNMNGIVREIKLENNRIFVYLQNMKISKGYPYFTKFKVELTENEEFFIIKIK